jgi:hypothetical protein
MIVDFQKIQIENFVLGDLRLWAGCNAAQA